MSESNGPAVRAAYALWKEMKARVWELAMTSKRVADLEARRLSKQWADEEDLRQDGYIGLERAALRFDPSQGVKFDTYARWWTRAEMTRALEQRGRTIRIPAGAAEQVRLINRVRSEWEGMGREFTLADVAERLSIDESRVRRLLSVGSAVSLETEVDTGSSRRALRSVIEEEIAPNPESFTTLRDQLSRLERVMAERLEVRERQVLIQRYGLEDGTFRTFKDIGKGMGISRERVRQIELTAFEKIRKNQLFRERTSRREWNRAA